MEKNKLRKRMPKYEMEDTYIPPHQRVFHLKGNTSDKPDKPDKPEIPDRPEIPDKPNKPTQISSRPDTDESGLDKAYADSSNLHIDSNGTLYVAGTKGNFWGSEWLENYKTMGVPLIENALGIPSTYKIEENERYKQLDNFMKMHPGQVKNLVGHSKGGAVVHTWMQNNPELKGQSRI